MNSPPPRGEIQEPQSTSVRRERHTNGPVHGADGTGIDELPNHDAQREVACPDSLHEEQVLRSRLLDELLGLGEGDRECLLAQNVLAGLEGQHGILEMVAVRGRNVDDVDVGVGHELRVRAVGFGTGRAVDLLDEAGGPVGRAGRGDGHDLVLDIGVLAGSRVGQEVLAES